MITKSHRILGYAGLLPFLGLAVMSWLGYLYAIDWLLSYAALIFSFLGGLIWYVSSVEKLPRHVLIVSISTMLWAWCWLLSPTHYWLWLAALSFIGLHLYERQQFHEIYSAELMRLRAHLSYGAAFFLWLAAMSTLNV